MKELPIVCTLGPEALHARREGLFADVVRRADACERLPEGLRLRFAPASETLSLITRAVDAERQCCRFLRFQIVLEPDEGPMYVELSGPAGTGEFIAALLNEQA